MRKVYVEVTYKVIIHLDEGDDLEEALQDCAPSGSSPMGGYIEDATLETFNVTDSK